MEKIIFKSKKIDSVFIMLYVGIGLFLMLIAAYDYWVEKDAMVLLVMGIIGVLLSVWVLASYYQLKIIIEGSFLKVHYFFKVYETDISKITKIRKGETMWSGFHKYGTATRGLIVFARYKNDLYITPEDEELFYQKILAANPNVTIEKVEH